MDKYIPQSTREKLWSVFLTGIVAMLLSMIQVMAGGEPPACGPQTRPAVAGARGLVPRAGPFFLFLFKQGGIETNANAAAASWLNYSTETDQPSLGDVIVCGYPKEKPAN